MQFWPRRRKTTSETPAGRSSPNPPNVEDGSSPPPRLWIPVPLRRFSLIVFICIFVTVGTVLGVLYGVSAHHSGLCSADSKFYYLWTYGPTAVATVLSAFWAQVEYRSKQMMPWNLMAKGPQPAEKSLLLDYVDPMNVVSLWKSVREKHFVVTAAIAGTFLIRLMAVLSSGLFVSVSTTLRQDDAALTAWNTFNGSGNQAVGAKPASVAYAALAYNLTYPEGTTSMYAYQLFNASSSTATNATGEVNVFSADLDCEIGHVTNVTSGSSSGVVDNPLLEGSPFVTDSQSPQASVLLSTESCDNLIVAIEKSNSMGWNGSTCANLEQGDDAGRLVIIFGNWTTSTSTIIPATQSSTKTTQLSTATSGTLTSGTLQSSTVTSRASTSTTLQFSVATDQASTSASLKLSTATTRISSSSALSSAAATDDVSINWIRDVSGDNSTADSSDDASTDDSSGGLVFADPEVTFHSTLALVCKPSYKVQRASVSLSKGTDDYWSPNVSVFANSTTSQLSGLSGWMVTKAFAQSIYQAESEVSQDFLGLLSAMKPNAAFATNSDELQDALLQLFRMVSAQYANSYLMSSIQDRFSGTVVMKESRLYLQSLSFGVIEATLILLISVTGFLYTKSLTMGAPRDPATIGGLSTILARSSAVVESFEGRGASTLRDIHDQIRNRTFETLIDTSQDSSFSIQDSSTRSEAESASEAAATQLEAKSEIKWWRPFAVSMTGVILILAAPPILILALEALYQYSKAHNGIADVDDDNVFVHYAWTYIPTTAMIGVESLFGLLDGAIKIFNPYHNLRKSAAPARISIMENYLGKLGIQTLFTAVRKLQYTVVAAASAMFLAPFLTIVISGLYNTAYVSVEQASQVQRVDGFQVPGDWPYSGIAGANLVLADNLTEPVWTYNDLAFPKLQVSSFASTISTTTNNSSSSQNATELRISVPAVRGVANCSITHANISACTTLPMFSYFVPAVDEYYSVRANKYFGGNGYFGQWTLLDAAVYPDCPSVVVSAGRVVNNKVTEVSYLTCAPYVEQVTVNATFALPDYTFSAATPPTAQNSTARVLDDTALANFEHYELANPRTGNATDEDLANMFGIVVHGQSGIPMRELVGAANEQRLLGAVAKAYGQIMAQELHAMRTTNTSSASSAYNADNAFVFNGTLVSSTRLRLKQSAISTRILEGLLAAMFICAAVTFVIMDTRKVLPKNPCSIAAVASLLAGSEILDTSIIPEGSEWLDDKELRQKGVFEGLVFSLGWWDGGDGASRFGIDVGRGAKKG